MRRQSVQPSVTNTKNNEKPLVQQKPIELPTIVYPTRENKKIVENIEMSEKDLIKDMYKSQSVYGNQEISKQYNISTERPPNYRKKDLAWDLLIKYGAEQEIRRVRKLLRK